MGGTAEIPAHVIAAAKREPYATIRADLAPIRCDGQVVGFYSANRVTRMGRRLGLLYVLPEYRRRGLVREVYASTPGELVAFVRHDNPASMALHTSCGFVAFRRHPFGVWLRRASS